MIPYLVGAYYWDEAWGEDYAVSTFFSSAEAARAFFDERVVELNPRLSPLQKQALLDASAQCFDDSKTWIPFDSESEALAYWQCLQRVVPGYINDPGIFGVLDIAVQGSSDVVARPDSIPSQLEDVVSGEQDIKIPWWLYAAAGLLLIKVMR